MRDDNFEKMFTTGLNVGSPSPSPEPYIKKQEPKKVEKVEKIDVNKKAREKDWNMVELGMEEKVETKKIKVEAEDKNKKNETTKTRQWNMVEISMDEDLSQTNSNIEGKNSRVEKK